MPYLNTDRTKYAEYFDWYEGRMDSLFTGVNPTQINGLENVTPAQLSTRFNYFGAISRFFSDAMSGDRPTAAQEAITLLTALTEHWSVTGESCLVFAGGRWGAVRPDYVYPQFNQYDKDVVERFLLVYPQRRLQNFNGDRDNRILYADSARVIDYDVRTGRATLSERQYRHGWVADLPTGIPVPVGPIIWINTGDGVYQDIDGMVREITVRLNILQSTLNSTARSILQIDKDSIADGAMLAGVTPDRVRNAHATGLGLTVNPPFIGEAEPRYVERSGVGLEESMAYLRLLLGQLAVMSGVPEYIFGVQLAQPNETERVLFAGQAKVNRFRRDIENVFEAIGLPIKFGTEPFVTRTQRITSIIDLFEAGIIDRNEARDTVGYAPSLLVGQPSGNRPLRVLQQALGGQR